jgi:methylmalonyl-CoA mutase N-terminal domain/subunit
MEITQASRADHSAFASRLRHVEAARDAAARVAKVKRERDADKARKALGALSEAAGGTANLQPFIREAVRAYCTVGEIAFALKEKFGVYQPPTRF